MYLEDADYYYVADISRSLITVADKSKAQREDICIYVKNVCVVTMNEEIIWRLSEKRCSKKY